MKDVCMVDCMYSLDQKKKKKLYVYWFFLYHF